MTIKKSLSKILSVSNFIIQSEMVSLNLFAERKISRTISSVIDQDMSKLAWYLSHGTFISLKDRMRQPSDMQYTCCFGAYTLVPGLFGLQILSIPDKAFRGVAMEDFLTDTEDLARWNAWFSEVTSNETIKPILADKTRLEKAYNIYTTGEGPAQALKAIKKGEAPP